MELSTFLDLCSGIGGGRLGLEKIGLKSIGYSDTSKLAIKTYKLMHDTADEPYYYNLKRIKTEKLPEYDMLIAGFPCQTFSVMGRKEGFSDDRGQINSTSHESSRKHNPNASESLFRRYPKRFMRRIKGFRMA